jgi:hypothetical protein
MLTAPSDSNQKVREDIALSGRADNNETHRDILLMLDFNDYEMFGARPNQVVITVGAVLAGPSTSPERYISAPVAFLLPNSKAQFEDQFHAASRDVLKGMVVKLRQAP